MKSMFKIFRRYFFTAASISIIILFINFFGLIFFSVYYVKDSNLTQATRAEIDQISDSLTCSDSGYAMEEYGQTMLEDRYSWAMLLDGNGTVVWDWQRPSGIKDSYTPADITSFSKWYLQDYPVTTWQYGDGLLVLAYPKDYLTKVNLNYPVQLIRHLPTILLSIVVLNLIIIIMLASFFGFRFYRALQPVALGIEGLANNEKVMLAEKGIACDLARSLNLTSKRLEKQSTELTRRDNARTEWISGVSHDIRTPLSMIMGYADGLEADTSLTSEQQKKASIIKNQSLIIKKLIEDLNLTSKLEYHMQPLNIKSFSPATLLREIISSYYNAGLPDQCLLELLIEPETETITLDGDTGLLTRALSNLIGNSLKHNGNDCTVTVSMLRFDDALHIHVSDSGQGIPSQVVKTLTNTCSSFSQKPHIMGLRVVWSILQAHGGHLNFIKKDSEDYYEAEIELPVSDNGVTGCPE